MQKIDEKVPNPAKLTDFCIPFEGGTINDTDRVQSKNQTLKINNYG